MLTGHVTGTERRGYEHQADQRRGGRADEHVEIVPGIQQLGDVAVHPALARQARIAATASASLCGSATGSEQRSPTQPKAAAPPCAPTLAPAGAERGSAPPAAPSATP